MRFVVLFVLPLVSAKGIMDLPKELVMDVNKETANVNVFATPADDGEAAEVLQSLRRASFLQAPLSLKVASSTKVAASDKLISSLKSELSSAVRSEVSYFMRALSHRGSFLQGPVSPSGIDMKNQLYLTQPLRTPSPASINVVETEAGRDIASRAETVAMASKANYLREQFRRDLIDLKA